MLTTKQSISASWFKILAGPKYWCGRKPQRGSATQPCPQFGCFWPQIHSLQHQMPFSLVCSFFCTPAFCLYHICKKQLLQICMHYVAQVSVQYTSNSRFSFHSNRVGDWRILYRLHYLQNGLTLLHCPEFDLRFRLELTWNSKFSCNTMK